jgi:hypothetical protein
MMSFMGLDLPRLGFPQYPKAQVTVLAQGVEPTHKRRSRGGRAPMNQG